MQDIMLYQELDGKLIKLENELRNSDERKKVKIRKEFLMNVENVADNLDKTAVELTTRYNVLTNAIGQKEKELKECSGVAEGLEAHGEVDYIIKKLEKIKGEINGLQIEIQELTKKIEQAVRDFSELKQRNKQAKEEYVAYKEKYDKLKAIKQPEIDDVKTKLGELRGKVSQDWMTKYDNKREQKIFPVFVKGQEGICGGCQKDIPMAKVNELKIKKIIECDECKRYIFMD